MGESARKAASPRVLDSLGEKESVSSPYTKDFLLIDQRKRLAPENYP